MMQLESDPVFQARSARQQEERDRREEQSLARQHPIMVMLRKVGLEGENTWDIIGQLDDVPEAATEVMRVIEVAARELRPRECEGLIRALGYVGNDLHIPRLIEMLLNEENASLKVAYQSSILNGFDASRFESIVVSIEAGFQGHRFPQMLVDGIAKLSGRGIRSAENRVRKEGSAARLMRAIDRFRSRG